MTLNQVVSFFKIIDYKKYINELERLHQDLGMQEKDVELLKSIFTCLKENNIKSATQLLEYEGDTYIREHFTNIILKFKS